MTFGERYATMVDRERIVFGNPSGELRTLLHRYEILAETYTAVLGPPVEKSGSHLIRRWRKEDSNRWSHLRIDPTAAPARCQPPASELD